MTTLPPLPPASCRLPNTSSPTHYDLVYHTVSLLPPYTFTGTITITLSIHTPTTSLTLHCVDLAVTEATFFPSTSSTSSASTEPSPSSPDSLSYNKKQQTLTLTFPQTLPIGQTHTLKLAFTGALNDQMRGFYRSEYTGLDGVKKIMACTQFEPTDARRAFPCYDEPSLKATFQITCTFPFIPGTSLVAVSNTPKMSLSESVSGSESSRMITYKFEQTPYMSTYLAALVIGEFDVVSKYSLTSKIQTSVYVMPGKLEQGRFCLETASTCLDFFIDYYGVDYPLTKSDLLAIPDFGAGAMENWGCVTYREAKILTASGTSLSTKKGIARTVCHELAHQWFGNYVTMEWWDGLFLNEGFARYMEFIAVSHIFPEWSIWTEFIQSVYYLAMGLDAMITSHPVQVKVDDVDEISDAFDAISYAKGASVIRMCAAYVTQPVFMNGIKEYLKRHAYGNAKVHELWDALESVSGKPVNMFMKEWTCQTGFPILTIDAEHNVTQRRFLAAGPDSVESINDISTWPLLLDNDLILSTNIDNQVDLPNQVNEVKAHIASEINDNANEGGWYKLNREQVAFYRINYPMANWRKLSVALAPGGKLGAVDRIGLLSDCFALGKAGYLPITTPLELVEKFGEFGEDEYNVWQELIDSLTSLTSIYKPLPFYPLFQIYIKKLFRKQYEILGWDVKEGEHGNTASFRAGVIGILGEANDEDVLSTALEKFNDYYENGREIQADLRRVVYKLALKFDEEGVKPKLFELYERTTFPEEMRNLSLTIGEITDITLVLNWALYSGAVKLQDIAFPLSTLSNPSFCWEYFQANYTTLHNTFGHGKVWGTIVATLTRGGSTMSNVKEIRSFFSTRDVGSAKRRVEQVVDVVTVRCGRIERDGDVVTAWLEGRK